MEAHHGLRPGAPHWSDSSMAFPPPLCNFSNQSVTIKVSVDFATGSQSRNQQFANSPGIGYNGVVIRNGDLTLGERRTLAAVRRSLCEI